MQRFTDIKGWQLSHRLALAVYRLTADFPRSEQFGVTSQLRRAAVSVPTNIAEGAKRLTDREYERFLNIAEGSLAETQYLLMLSKDLGMADGTINATMEQAAEAARVLHGLRVKVASAR